MTKDASGEKMVDVILIGNIPRPGVVPCFSDLKVVSLSFTMESIGIDSENYLFAKLLEYSTEMLHLISRRQFNDRRKFTANLCKMIRDRIVAELDSGGNYFCIDSKPVEVCRISRAKRCKIGKNDYGKASAFGYCASQNLHYYGYKLHAVCGLSGVTYSFDLTKANVHDIHYLKDVKGIFRRVISRISTLTVLQYINKINNSLIGRVEYALI